MHYIIKALLVLATFMFCHFMMRDFWGQSWSDTLLNLDQQSYVLHNLLRYVFIYGPLLAVAIFLFKNKNWYEVLGIEPTGAQHYFIAALVCCLPMILGYAYLSTEIRLSWSGLTTGSLYAGFFEEVIFRGALFGVLFRFCRWGFISAALVSSIIFGLGHMYQGHDAASALLAMVVTAIGGTWFAWLYCECQYRLWFPIAMHILMNAAYGIFGMTGGAAGDLHGNIFKASSIILSLVYVQLLIRQGKKREVTRDRLWVNSAVDKTDPQPQPPFASKESSYV